MGSRAATADGHIAHHGAPMTQRRITATSAMAFVVLFGAIDLLGDANYEGGRSLVGQFLQLLGSSAFALGIAVGAGEFLGYALRFISGYAADRTGQYWRITLAGYGVQMLALPLLAFVGQWQVAIALLFAERIGKAIRNPSRDAMLSFATKEMGRGWGFGLHEAMDQTGAVLGPALMSGVLLLRGGTPDLDGYRLAFLVLFVPAVLSMVLLLGARALFPAPRSLEPVAPRAGTHGLSRRFWIYVVAAGLVAAGIVDFALIAYHLETKHVIAPELVPLLFSGAMIVSAPAALISGRLFDRWPFATLLIAFGVAAFAAPLVFLGSAALLIVGMALWGLAMALENSILRAAIADLVAADRRAYGYGVFSLVFGLFWFAGSAAMGALYDVDVRYLVAFSVLVQLAALPIFALSRRAHA
jgi:MFS family permease